MEHKDLKELNDFMYNLGYDMGDKNDVYELGVLMDKVRKTLLELYQLPDEEFEDVIEKFDDVEFAEMGGHNGHLFNEN